MCCGTAQAATTGADLLTVCDTALKTNFRGMNGKMCIWYVTPCDCDFGGDTALPPVCLPDSVSNLTLAFMVTEMLKATPEFQKKDAGEAAALILSEVYPCAG